MNLKPLCADPSVWSIRRMAPEGDQIVLELAPMRRAVACPVCQTMSQRIHSRYRRHPRDLPWAKWPVELWVSARRFFCNAPQCPRQIFAERFPEVLIPYACQTERRKQVLLELTHASSAQRAAQVARQLGYLTSPDTLLRLQRKEPIEPPSPQVLGVDEFALRRGRTYATLLVDLERHQPIDVLEGRDAQPLIRWLRAHPPIRVLARDRAEAYALAGRTAAPGALQVADRFHLVCNVSDALKELVRSGHWSLPTPVGESEKASGEPPSSGPTTPEEQPQATPRKQAAWEAVQQRKATGQPIKSIARELGMDRRTVRKYLATNQAPVCSPRRTKLTPYLLDLWQRWTQGCHNARRLYQELLQQGYRGSEGLVKRAVRPWRSTQKPPKPRQTAAFPWLVLRPSSGLTDPEREELERILQANPQLALGYQLKERFQELISRRDLAALDPWIGQAAQSGLSPFESLARSFRQDEEAIQAALTTPWSTAQCEGQICRVKLIKRVGCGRAKLDLLRKRVLHRMPVPSIPVKQHSTVRSGQWPKGEPLGTGISLELARLPPVQ